MVFWWKSKQAISGGEGKGGGREGGDWMYLCACVCVRVCEGV